MPTASRTRSIHHSSCSPKSLPHAIARIYSAPPSPTHRVYRLTTGFVVPEKPNSIGGVWVTPGRVCHMCSGWNCASLGSMRFRGGRGGRGTYAGSSRERVVHLLAGRGCGGDRVERLLRQVMSALLACVIRLQFSSCQVYTEENAHTAHLSSYPLSLGRCHNAATGLLRWEIPKAHRAPVTCCAARFDSSAAFLVTGAEDGSVSVWELRTRCPANRIPCALNRCFRRTNIIASRAFH